VSLLIFDLTSCGCIPPRAFFHVLTSLSWLVRRLPWLFATFYVGIMTSRRLSGWRLLLCPLRGFCGFWSVWLTQLAIVASARR